MRLPPESFDLQIGWPQRVQASVQASRGMIGLIRSLCNNNAIEVVLMTFQPCETYVGGVEEAANVFVNLLCGGCWWLLAWIRQHTLPENMWLRGAR